MKRNKTLAFLAMSIWALLLAAPDYSFAEEFSLHYSIVESETLEGEIIQGTIEVLILNGSTMDLDNVNLRLEHGGTDSIGGDVFQLGQIPAGEVANGAVAIGGPVQRRIVDDHWDVVGGRADVEL